MSRTICILLGSVMLLLSVWLVQADSGERADRHISATLPVAPNVDLSPVPPAAGARDQYRDARVVFQQFDNESGWQVRMINDGIFGPPATIAGSPASEIQPNLSRGAEMVVFVSDAAGSYDLYSMAYHGGGLRQLTSGSADETAPKWSPDGTQIAYQSDLHGQPDIFIMNADGGNVRRMTTHPDYDGMPTWSPDGKQLAFISRRTGGYRIYTLDVNGGNLRQVNNTPYSFRPQWSPDGRTIAFDGDPDGDTWQELMTVDLETAQVTVLADRGHMFDTWASGWSPSGEHVVYSLVDFIVYQGQLYIEALMTERIEVSNHYAQPFINQPLSAGADWVSTDTVAPQSSLYPLPQYSLVYQPYIQWRLTDEDPDSFNEAIIEIEVRVGENGTWQPFVAATYGSIKAYAGTVGETVYFRSRARDDAYNYEAWESPYGEKTTLVAGEMRGTVVDNRGNRLPHAPLAIAPQPVEPAQSDAAGQFHAYTLSTTTHKVTLPNGDFPATPNGQYNMAHYLPPQDSAITAGSFEQLGDWILTDMTRTAVAAHSGTLGLAGASCTDPCVMRREYDVDGVLENAGQYDDAGNLHIIGRTLTDNLTQMVIAPDGTVTQTAIPNSSNLQNIHLQIDGDTLYMLGSSGSISSPSRFYHFTKSKNGAWQKRTTVMPTSYGLRAVALAQNGAAALVLDLYNSEESLVHIRYDDGWQSAETLTFHSGYSSGSGGRLGFDAYGRVHLLWGDDLLDANGFYMNVVRYAVRDVAGSWHDYGVVLTQRGLFGMAVDAGGNLHTITAEFGSEERFYQRLVNGSATVPIPIEIDGSNQIRMTVDATGTVYVVYRSFTGSLIQHQLPHGATQFSQTILTTQYDGNTPTLIPSPAVGATVAWGYLGYDPDTQTNIPKLRYTARTPAASATEATAQQVVTVGTAEAQTLSWLARGVGDIAPDDETQMVVTVDDGSALTELAAPQLTMRWQPFWADMSAWAGKTVTVTFGVKQAMGEPRLNVAIDNVALGAATPNTWVRLVSDKQMIANGEQVAVTIHYGNHAPLAATDGEVTLTLPVGFTVVDGTAGYNVTGNVVRWQVGEISAENSHNLTLQYNRIQPLNTTITIQAEISHGGMESADWDNTANVNLRYGFHTFLPVIRQLP